MSILTKVLIGLVIVSVFPVMYLAASVLNVQTEWHKKVRDLQVALAKQQKEHDLLLHGDFQSQTKELVPGKPVVGTPGLVQWRTARDNMMRGASRVWYGRPQAASISPDTGTLKFEVFDDQVNFDMSARAPLTEHGMLDKMVLYVFQVKHSAEPTPGSDKYLGEFVVNGLPPGTNEPIIPLKPALPLTAGEWDALKTSAAAAQWIVFDKMPVDSHDVFTGVSEDEIRKLIPAGSVDEYLNDNQAPTAAVTANPELGKNIVTDPVTKKATFVRPLREYQIIFASARTRMADMNDRLQILVKEKQYAEQALVNLKDVTIPALDARKTRLEKEVALVDAELKVVTEHVAKLTEAIDQSQKQIVQLLLENKRKLEQKEPEGKLTRSSGPAPLAVSVP